MYNLYVWLFWSIFVFIIFMQYIIHSDIELQRPYRYILVVLFQHLVVVPWPGMGCACGGTLVWYGLRVWRCPDIWWGCLYIWHRWRCPDIWCGCGYPDILRWWECSGTGTQALEYKKKCYIKVAIYIYESRNTKLNQVFEGSQFVQFCCEP